MTNEEARAYFINCNERIVSVAKDENIYNYKTQQVEDVFMRRTFEANESAIKALAQKPCDNEYIKVPKPCEDCISRKAAIDACLNGWNKDYKEIVEEIRTLPPATPQQEYGDIAMAFQLGLLFGKADKAIEEVKKTVTPQQKTGWIPVSEGLPKKFSYVNCTCRSLIDDRASWVIETCYVPQPSNSPYSDWGNIPMLNRGECEVIAWMYRDIPKPYKAESEG